MQEQKKEKQQQQQQTGERISDTPDGSIAPESVGGQLPLAHHYFGFCGGSAPLLIHAPSKHLPRPSVRPDAAAVESRSSPPTSREDGPPTTEGPTALRDTDDHCPAGPNDAGPFSSVAHAEELSVLDQQTPTWSLWQRARPNNCRVEPMLKLIPGEEGRLWGG